MNYSKNVKRSVTYEFQLTNSKFLPVARYKGNNKFYQLNLSKMLMKCPESPFTRNIQVIQNPEQLLIVSTSKYHNSSQKQKPNVIRHPVNCKSQFSRTKVERLKKNIRDTLRNQGKFQFQPFDFEKKLFEDDYNRTMQSPNSPGFESKQKTPAMQSPPNISKHSSRKNLRNQLIVVRNKKLYISAVQASKKQQQSSKMQNEIINIKSVQKNQSYQSNPIKGIEKNIPKKPSFKISQNQILKRAKISKKVLLPEIKQSNERNDKNQSHTYNIGSKSNIPLLFRDPQQLKHIKAESYAIVQYPTGNLILSNKGSNQYEIASLTKIMTFYTIIKLIGKYNISIQEEIKINDSAMQMTGTSAEILSGQTYTIQQLLYGLMLPSGNDAATALAQWGGKVILKHFHPHLIIHSNTFSTKHLTANQQSSQVQPSSKSKIKAFITQMNNHAKQLGLSSTRFANPHGLPHSDAKSTSIDVARLSFQCMKDQLFKKVISTHKFKCVAHNHSNKSKRVVEWTNTNKLLRREGFIGIKTGITVTAGPCLASAYKFRDKIYICVLLRATKISRRFKQTRKLIAWSLQKLYKNSLTTEQLKILNSIKKNKPDFDSDYSQDQQQFNYQEMSKAQIKKRSNIINYQM